MAPHKRLTRQTICTLLLGGLLAPYPSLWAADFNTMDWQPKPLVDTSLASPVTKPAETGQTPAPVPQPKPDLEAKLKPAEPFIREVENQLLLQSQPEDTLIQRLNALQLVLFGELQYQDAGELLAKLAELFPQEAEKAQADLNNQLKTLAPQGKPELAKTGKSQQTGKQTAPPTATSYPSYAPAQNEYPTLNSAQTATMQTPAQLQTTQKPVKKKRSMWGNDWDSVFENDPFFQDEPNLMSSNTATSMGAPAQPSRIGAIGQGLAGLAMLAGGVAGNYYLNRKMGNNNFNNGYPNQQPYYNPYYGYGPQYYGGPYGQPMGYGQFPGGYPVPGQTYYNFPQNVRTYSTPYQGGSIGRPYNPISPLGAATGLIPSF